MWNTAWRRAFFSLTLGATLLLTAALPSSAGAEGFDQGRMLGHGTRFFRPGFEQPARLQFIDLLIRQQQFGNAQLISRMEQQPRAVWISGGTPGDAARLAHKTVRSAAETGQVAVLSLYNIPGRDCAGLSAGGALTTADYQAWIQAIAQGIGDRKAVVILEPDSLGLLPTTECGFNASTGFTDAGRFEQLNFAVDTLEKLPQTSVYLDGTHSHWKSTGDISVRLVKAGLMRAQGFYLNVSNFRATSDLEKYGTWISECIAFANNPADGGWRLGHYDFCASQYFSGAAPNDGKPGDAVNADDPSTWHWSDLWFSQNLGTAVPTAHFVIDTSRNGQQPPWIVPAGVFPDPQDFCNPPNRGLGLRSSANTGVALVDAFLWVKVPGESDGSCARGLGPAGATIDPVWGVIDPAAGTWFPQQALQLAQLANPPLSGEEQE